MTVVLGVDVAKRALDLVAMDSSSLKIERVVKIAPADFSRHLLDLQPSHIAIDGPSGWALPGNVSRACERELHGRGVHIFWTADAPAITSTAGPTWVMVGFDAYRACFAAGYRLFRSGPVVEHDVIEVYPHVSAVSLRGVLPPAALKKMTKRDLIAWRRQALEDRGVDTTDLKTLDEIDGALAALTAVLSARGEMTLVGDPNEGVLVVPTRSLPNTFTRQEAAHTPLGHRLGWAQDRPVPRRRIPDAEEVLLPVTLTLRQAEVDAILETAEVLGSTPSDVVNRLVQCRFDRGYPIPIEVWVGIEHAAQHSPALVMFDDVARLSGSTEAAAWIWRHRSEFHRGSLVGFVPKAE